MPMFKLEGNALHLLFTLIPSSMFRENMCNLTISTLDWTLACSVFANLAVHTYVPLRTLSYNSAEQAVVVTISSDNGLYKLATLLTQLNAEVKDYSIDGKHGAAHNAIFVERNSSTSSILLYGLQQEKAIVELNSPPVKYVTWRSDSQLVALMSKHTVIVVNKKFSEFVKPSASSPELGMTQEYSYIPFSITSNSASLKDCSTCPWTITSDPTEYHFKLALLCNNHEEILHLMGMSRLIEQSIIAYLQQKGSPKYWRLQELLIDLSVVISMTGTQAG
ncbi:hypothetical protein F5141DRAFT_1262848 [Pisolithus sp. B1]|nr:hypothetical protein F5141DRAFT_1262848 [Pisolithus sp. B1]